MSCRRRNAYAGVCCLCGSEVPAGEGWLYSDTGRRRRIDGRWHKKVKCDRCHSAGYTGKADLAPKAPAARRWSASDVSRWPFEVAARTGRAAGRWLGEGVGYEWAPVTIAEVHVTVNGERVRLAGADYLGRQGGPDDRLEWGGIGGRAFTPAAWERLIGRLKEAIENPKA